MCVCVHVCGCVAHNCSCVYPDSGTDNVADKNGVGVCGCGCVCHVYVCVCVCVCVCLPHLCYLQTNNPC